jgi:hypothetical protein
MIDDSASITGSEALRFPACVAGTATSRFPSARGSGAHSWSLNGGAGALSLQGRSAQALDDTSGSEISNVAGFEPQARPSTGRGGGSVDGGASHSSAISGASFVLHTGAVLPLERNISAALSLRMSAGGVGPLLASYPRKTQVAIREMAVDVVELVHRQEALQARMAKDQLRQPGEAEPLALPEARLQLRERLRRLIMLCGSEADAEIIVEAVTSADTREAAGVVATSEEFATSDEEARLWRRRMDPRRVQPVRSACGQFTVSHDSPTARGDLDPWNERNRFDPEESLSSYQKQQLKYGRGRRGSTAVAGAWEAVFGSLSACNDEETGNTSVSLKDCAQPSAVGVDIT